MVFSNYYVRHSIYGAGLWMLGDVMSQYYEGFEKNKLQNTDLPNLSEFDMRRASVMTGYGFAAGSLYYYWYQKLDKLAPFVLKRLNILKTPMRISATKLSIDMVSFDPFFISLFFFSTSMLTGSSLTQFKEHYKTYFLPTYLVEALIW
eukprot:NODE_70_length_24940_cov_0.663138.p18 type:complete len:148 gc:universal NODE_70_length_24940_cov_0.663138:9784-9341(-)